jgi:hypothetical protein
MRVFGIWVLMGLMGLMGYDAFERRARNARTSAAPAQEQAPDSGDGSVQAMEDGTQWPGPPK